uniref:Uncharacterized protein n=1 Tax=Oryza nivara TaxID=4536 RepID=A0A0E0FFZ9_ORYNI
MAAYSFNVQAGAGEMAAIGVSVQVRAREGRGVWRMIEGMEGGKEFIECLDHEKVLMQKYLLPCHMPIGTSSRGGTIPPGTEQYHSLDSTRSTEKVTKEEAPHLIHRLRDAKRRIDEKLDRLLEMFGVKVDKESNGAEEFNDSTKELTPTTEAATSSSPHVSRFPMPTKCSTICSDHNTMPDLTMATMVTSTTASMSSMELMVGEDAISDPYIGISNHPKEKHTECSTVVLNSNNGIVQVEGHQDFFDAIGESYDLFTIKELWNYSLIGILLCMRINTKSLQLELASMLLELVWFRGVRRSAIVILFDWKKWKFVNLGGYIDSAIPIMQKYLAEQKLDIHEPWIAGDENGSIDLFWDCWPQHVSFQWQQSWIGGHVFSFVYSEGSLLLVNFMQDVSKDGIISYDIEGIAECTQVSYFASILPDIAILPTEMMLTVTVRHWAVHLMLPWPPPHENSTVLLIDAHAFVKLGRANMVEAKEHMKLSVAKLYVLDLSCATPSIGHFGNHGLFQLSMCKMWPQFMLWKIWSFEAKMKLLIVGHPKQYIKDTILVLVEVRVRSFPQVTDALPDADEYYEHGRGRERKVCS